MKARFIQEIGTRVSLRIYWGEGCQPGKRSYHNAQIHWKDSKILNDQVTGGEVGDHPESRWPTVCDHCNKAVPVDANRQVFRDKLYNTASGKPEPRDLYYIEWPSENYYWDNHKGPMLCACLPNGEFWNLDSRASNCTLPQDRLHRCWVRHGEPPNIHVDKNGLTCNAGAGSIQTANYHGFLHNGEFHT